MTANDSLAQLLLRLEALAALPLEQASAMPPDAYTSEDLLALEREMIFPRQWLCVGLAASLPNAGDFLCDTIAGQPVVIIRQADGSLSAFANVCRHRMMTLLKGQGNCKRIVCPYHAWAYDRSGRLVSAPYMEQSEGFDRKQVALKPIRCETWHGWIYLTLDPDLPPVNELLARLEPLVLPYAMANYVPIDRKEHVWRTNWKQLCENFMEGYHLPVAHRATVGAWFPVEETRFEAEDADPSFTYQFFTKSADARVGVAHPDNTRLEGEARRTAILPTVFPSHMYMLAPDHCWYLSLEPVSTGEVRVRYGAALAPEVLAASKDPEGLKAQTRNLLDQVNEEDRIVVEGIFAGASSPLAEAGRLSWLERENHEFTGYLVRQLLQ
jgi:phenylpropionate dioxygenase-like ring-hydroxylating dioxygenase large terminal subunit